MDHGKHSGHLGAYKRGDKDDIDGDIFDFFARIEGFLNTFFAEGDINPACKEVSFVPHGFPMSKQNQLSHSAFPILKGASIDEAR